MRRNSSADRSSDEWDILDGSLLSEAVQLADPVSLGVSVELEWTRLGVSK